MPAQKANGHEPAEAIPVVRLAFHSGEPLTLPFSGVTVMARKTSMLGLMRYGMDFGQLQAMAARMAMEGTSGATLLADPEGRTAYLSLLDACARRMLVRPKVVDRPEDVLDPDRQVCIDDIDEEDRQYLFLWNQGLVDDAEAEEATADTAAFPDDAGSEAAGLDAVPDREPVRATA